MSVLLWSAILLVVYALARWGGGTLSRHYGDGSEVAAALTVALGTVLPMALVDYTDASETVVVPLVAVALAAGLITGYGRHPRGGGPRRT